MHSGTVSKCGNYGEIIGGSILGGIAGAIYSGNIEECYNRTKITGDLSIGTGFYVGGIIGSVELSSDVVRVYDSYNTGVIKGYECIGGLIGTMPVPSKVTPTYVNRCYSIGNVTGTTNIGSFYGIASNIESDNCYSGVNIRGSGYVINAVWGNSCEANVPDKIKNLTVDLGDKFKKDISPTINYGYPILKWEK